MNLNCTLRRRCLLLPFLLLFFVFESNAQQQCPTPTVSDITVCDGESTLITPTIPGVGGPEVLGMENFDGGGIGYTPSIDFNDGPNDHFSLTDGTDITNVSGQYSFQDGVNMFWAAEDVDDTGGNGLDEQSLALNSINISGFNTITICMDMAAGNENGPGSSAYDAADHVLVQYGTDVNPAFVNALCYNYENNGDNINEPLHHDPNCDGDGSEGALLGNAAQTFCFNVHDSLTTGVGAATLDIQILVYMDAGNEEIAFDNIEVIGTPLSAPMFKYYDADPLAGGVLLAGPTTGSYDPGTTPGNSPETIWVTFCDAATGCESAAAPVVVTVNELPTIAGIVSNVIDCPGDASGSISVTPGGNGPFSYSWSNDSTDQNQNSLNAGDYTLTVTDANGCTLEETFTVLDGTDTTPPVITCPASPLDVSCGESTLSGAIATATDNCTANLAISYTDNLILDGCGGLTGTLTRTWMAIDESGNTATCNQIINIIDTEAPGFTLPTNVIIACNDDPTDMTLTGMVTDIMDNCGVNPFMQVWVNELHYDNFGSDVNEGIEIAGTAGIDLAGYSLELYNGNGGGIYNTILLAGVIPDEGAGYGAINFGLPPNGLQNGSPDGFALLDPNGVILYFLSYEGTMTASNGSVVGMTSTSIPFSEGGGNPVDNSLQVTGTGNNVNDFSWQAAFAHSRGFLNVGQMITPLTFPAPTVTSSDVFDGSASCGTTGVVTRTWTVTDACGNSTSLDQVITLTDTQAPVITCPPGQTLTCFESLPAPLTSGAEFIAAGGTISDNCTSDLADFVVFSSNDNNGGDNCPGNARVVVRTYFIQDACGNTSSCDQTFTYLESTSGPVITSILPTCYKYCASLANPMASDITYDTDCNFGASVTINGPLQIGSDNCPGTIYRYTYIVTDDCGRSSAPAFRDFIIGNDGPTIECPTFNLILECNDPNNQTYVANHLALTTVNTACELGYTLNHFPQNFNFTACGSSTVVTFVATDACGRTATCTTTIAIQDTEAPVITNVPPSICDATECGGDVDYWFDHWVAYMLNGLAATDQCDNNVSFTTIPSNPQLNTNCDPVSGEAVTTVTFVAHDNCGNTATHVGIFTVENEFPAAFQSVPADATVSCGDPIVFGPAPTVVNACQTTVSLETNVDSSDPCNVLHMRTWTATDACGGLTTAVTQMITEVDDAAPVISGGSDMTVECDGIGNLTELQAWLDGNADASASDACGNGEHWSNDFNFANVVLTPDCAGGVLAYVDVTFTATDNCGNASSITQRFNVEDTTAPTFTFVPTGGTVECVGDVAFGDATAEDLCSGAIVTFNDVTTGDDCSGSVTRTWTATDACGNATTASATINYIDTQEPTASNVPADMTIDCSESVVFGADPIWTDNCDDDVFNSFEDILTPGDCTGNYSIERFWAGIDECGNLGVVSQTITVEDNTAPVFTFVPADSEQDCGNNPVFEDAAASDDCGTTTITFEDVTSGMGCAGSVTRTWTATDDCGNTSTASATITFSDDEAPEFTYVPGTPDLNCDDDLTPEPPVATDNCGAVTVEITDEDINGALCDDGYAAVYTWTATDACGNTATVETTIWVNPDNEAPEFTFVPEGELINCDQFPPTFGDPVVEDDCGSFTLTYIDEYVTGGLNSCDEGENFDYRRTWTATDGCGNSSTAKQTFWVKPESVSLSGMIHTEMDEAVEDVEVTLAGGGNFYQSYVTGDNGLYNFADLPLESNYVIDPYSNEFPMNGVSTYDLVLISKHILELQTLDSPYKMIAADINHSGTITTLDMVELRMMVLFINTEFTNNDSWRFVEASFVFPFPDNPFSTVFPEVTNINGLLESEQHDFVGVKIGDVNGSVIANGLMGSEDRSFQGELNFELENQLMEADATYEVTFRASDFQSIAGYQYSIGFDNSQLEFVDVAGEELAGLSKANFGLSKIKEGVITTSWNSNEAISMRDGSALFTLSFKAKSTVNLSEVIYVSSRYTIAEAYNGDLELMNVNLRFDESTTTLAEFKLNQNQPNPFKQNTAIGFSLPESSKATLTFFDVSGKVLKQISGDFVKGYNEVSLNRNELQTSGLVYYELVTPTHTATKRMLLTNN